MFFKLSYSVPSFHVWKFMGPTWQKTLQYSNIATITSSALKLLFSSVHGSQVVIWWSTQTSWMKHSSFCGVQLGMGSQNVVYISHHCCQHTIHCLTVQTSRNLFSSQWIMPVADIFSTFRNSMTFFLRIHFHVRLHLVKLPLCCHLSHVKKMKENVIGNIQQDHQHSSLIS